MKIDPGTLLSQQARLAQSAQDLVAAVQPATSGAPAGAESGDFLSVFEGAVQGVDAQARDAAHQMAAVDSGQSDDLVGAMLASQQASLSFSLLMQVRNKLMGAVDELVKLQV